jgi:hypothetical protein
MLNLGKVKPGTTLYIPFDTFGTNGESLTMSGLAAGDIKVYKDGGTTERASTSGFTLLDTDGIDFDSLTGIHGVSISLADNTTAGFWAAGSKYFVVIDSITVNTQTVRFVVATFEIAIEGAVLSTTIATLSSQTSFTLTDGPAEDDALNGCVAYIHDVASAVQGGFAVVLDYTGASKTVTLTAGTTFTAAATDNIGFFPPVNTRWIGATAQTANDIGDDANTILIRMGTPSDFGGGATISANLSDIEAQTDDIGAAGAGLTAVPWNAAWDAEVQSEVQDALEANNLDHLVGTATGIPAVPAGTFLRQIMDDGTATYDRTTDSLQAIRDASASLTDLGIIASTTIATLSSQTSFTLTAGSADNSAYVNCRAIITDASTAVQKATGKISAYTGATKTVTLAADPGIFTMAAGDLITILPPSGVDSEVSTIKTKTDFLPSATAGSAGGLFIAGSNAATTVNVTGNITGNLSGSVGSVTGAVGSVGAGGITASTFAAGAIDAAAIAADAIGSSELAASAASEIATAVRTELGTELGRIDAAVSSRATAAAILTTALTEAYRTAGSAGTLSEILYELLSSMTEFTISGTTKTNRKIDGVTTATTHTLNSSTAPTSVTRAT